MFTSVLSAEKDPMGAAIAEFYSKGRAGRLRVFSPQFDEDEIPVATLFRSLKDMPELEQVALSLAKGKILDVGAGSGCHSVALRDMNKNAFAIDISPLSVKVMQERGLEAQEINIFEEHFIGQFDTILMLMNGSGIIGKIKNMGDFFNRMKQLLAPQGCILMDSTDLRYLFEDEDGSMLIDLASDYYGEMEFSMQYKQIKGDSFPWLYIDFDTLQLYASQYGFKAEKIKDGEHYDYLARLTCV